jgi:hypothetical protein
MNESQELLQPPKGTYATAASPQVLQRLGHASDNEQKVDHALNYHQHRHWLSLFFRFTDRSKG